MPPTLRLALPKGSLQDATFQLFRQAGYKFAVADRSYLVNSDDPEIEAMLIRPQEMAHYIQIGKLDAGLTGWDWVIESGADVHEVAALPYSKASARPVRWVLAVPNESPVRAVEDLQGKTISTEVVNITRQYLKKHGVEAEVEFSWGATEVKAHQFVDAIVEATETGNSLRANRLRIVDTVLESTTRLIANRAAWADPAKRDKIESIVMLLRAAIAAQDKVGLKMNVPAAARAAIVALLPALTSPTVSPLADPDWVAMETIVSEGDVKRLIPALRRAGARGIIEYPLNKLID
jgi:ATP phosphoribosyltransferase